MGFWEIIQPGEYGFWANVNPKVPHPRWSQAMEWVLHTGELVPTQIYNGYGAQVAALYAGMELATLFMWPGACRRSQRNGARKSRAPFLADRDRGRLHGRSAASTCELHGWTRRLPSRINRAMPPSLDAPRRVLH